jgi:hypothetical protein
MRRDKKVRGTIYLITQSATGKSYVGLTRRPFKVRMQGHWDAARKGIGSSESLWSAIRLHGKDAFSFKILEVVSTIGQLSDREKYWIDKLQTLTPLGFNQNRGGSVSEYPTIYVVQGNEYWGAANLADEFGIYEETLRARLNAGWSVEQAVEISPRPKSKRSGTKYKIGDKTFSSETEMSVYFGITPEKFRSRFYVLGWSLEESLELEKRTRFSIKVGDTTFASLREACQAFETPREKVRSRIKRGWSIDQAFEIISPPESKKTIKQKSTLGELFLISINGKTYKSASAISQAFGIKEKTLIYRLKRGHSGKQLIQKRISGTGKPVNFRGNTYLSISEAVRSLGLKLQTVNSRIRYGWTIEEALSQTRRHQKTNRLYKIRNPEGKILTSTNLSKFCREHSLKTVSALFATYDSDKHHTYKGFSLLSINKGE